MDCMQRNCALQGVSRTTCCRPSRMTGPVAFRRSLRRHPVSVETVMVGAQGAQLEDLKARAAALSSALDPATAPEAAASSFPWTAHWYPVAIVDDLDPRRPHDTHLLGIPLALWRDSQGQWRAVEDKCPHRLAPLSEGRIEKDGTLQCAYHGWQFNGSGACTHIPQLRGDDKAMQAACSSRRACVRAFPVQVAHGLLWVLPDSSHEAHDKFAKSPQLPGNVIKELMGGPEAEGWRQTTQWFARDLPIRFDTLCENIVDPSHVPFAHHGVQGRRENEKGSVATLIGDVTMEGFKFEFDRKSPGWPPSQPEFIAPNLVRYPNPVRTLIVYAMPTRPGWSRIVATFTQDTRVRSPLPWIVGALFGFVESTTWLEHILQRNPVLDGDTYMLHVQERLLLQQNNDWKTSFYMPAKADSSVIAWRKWLDTYGGAVPTCEPGTPMPPAMTKQEVLDRYSQHTVNCRHCKKAIRNIDVATAVAAACGLVAAAWLVARGVLGQPFLAPATAGGFLAAFLCGAMVAALRTLRQQFFFIDYVHAEKK